MPYKILSTGALIKQNDELIINFTFISESDFLLVIALTSNAKLIILYRSGSTFRLERFVVSRYFPAQRFTNKLAPAAIAITPDATVIVIILSNFEILLLPLKCLMQFHWGETNAVIRKPFKFSLDTSVEGFRLIIQDYCCPTSAFCFNSALDRTYLVIGEKNGTISIIDLNIRTLCARLNSGESICKVQYYSTKNSKSILVTHFNKTQFLIPLELEELTIRSPLTTTISSVLKNLDSCQNKFYVLQNLQCSNNCNDHSLMCSYDIASKKVNIYSSFLKLKDYLTMYGNVPFEKYNIIQYTSKVLFIVTETSNEIFVFPHFLSIYNDSELSSALWHKIDTKVWGNEGNFVSGILDILPLNKSSELEECLLIAKNGLFWLRPEESICLIVANFLATKSFFSSLAFQKISSNLSLDSDTFYENILHTIFHEGSKAQQEILDGFISLGIQIGLDIKKILDILNKHNEADLLLPFLLSSCEKNPTDSSLCQLLFNAYMSKLGKLNYKLKNKKKHSSDGVNFSNEISKLVKQKETLEYEIKNFFIKFNHSVILPDVFSLLMRHSLWSCVAVILSNDRLRNNHYVVRFLSELSTWRDITNLDGFLRCLSLIEWPTTESTSQMLVTKMIGIIPNLKLTTQFQIFVDISQSLLKKNLDFALPLYLISSACLLSCLAEIKLNSYNESINNVKLSCGSNCTAAVLDDGNVSFWGDFTSGMLRLSNDTQKNKKIVKGSPLKTQFSNFSLPISSKEKNLNHMRSAFPKIMSLPPKSKLNGENNSEYKIKSVSCGTEHVLLLTSEGQVLSWGQNRYGQCGVGTIWPVLEPTLITCGEEDVNFGKMEAIFAGHYHSAMINNCDEVWMWGWGMHGQLATGNSSNKTVPKKILNLCGLGITTICLGYSHSLFKLLDNSIVGCGATFNGQLGIDPKEVKAEKIEAMKHLFGQTNCELKTFGLIKLNIPNSVSLISSKYFHTVAICPFNTTDNETSDSKLSENLNNALIYEWGDCPLSIRMRQLLMQRLESRELMDQKMNDLKTNVQEDINNTENKNPTTRMMSALSLTNLSLSTTQLLQRMARKRTSQSPTSQSSKFSVVLPVDTPTIGCTDSSLYLTGKNVLSSIRDNPRDYFKICRRCIWLGGVTKGTIQQLSAGYNHSAFITSNGELYTWGKGLEMQLGHGDKKDRELPTLVVLEPPNNLLKWAHVECGRNFTMAVSVDGKLFVWGRNDKAQLGVGPCKNNNAGKTRKIIIKPKSSNTNSPTNAGTKVVELPSNETNIEVPTLIRDVEVHVQKAQLINDIEREIYDKLKTSDQYTLNTISKFFIKNPIKNFDNKINKQIGVLNSNSKSYDIICLVLFCIAEMHILAGNLLNSVDVLSLLLDQKNNLEITDEKKNDIIKSPKDKGVNIFSVKSNKTNYNGQNSFNQSFKSTTPTKKLSSRENSLSSSNLVCAIENSSKVLLTSNLLIIERFEELVDRIWNLIRFHPQRDIQTIALLLMLRFRFPIYHRLAADNRLCRMIEGYLDGGNTGLSRSNSPGAFFNNTNLTSSGSCTNRNITLRLSEMNIRERYVYLKRVKLVVFLTSQQQTVRLKSLRQKCDQISNCQANRLRFYTDCSHYEKCVVESGAAKMQFATLRNRLRKCSRCVSRSRFSIGSHLVTTSSQKK